MIVHDRAAAVHRPPDLPGLDVAALRAALDRTTADIIHADELPAELVASWPPVHADPDGGRYYQRADLGALLGGADR
jgi:hypothetical protein